jgi:hypothetical protein
MTAGTLKRMCICALSSSDLSLRRRVLRLG